MEVAEFDIPIKDSRPIYLGLNLSRNGLRDNVNLFALRDNNGASISDHLWTTANYIAKHVLLDKPVETINWTLTSGARNTELKFLRMDGKPLKIDISDKQALEYEKEGTRFPPSNFVYSLEVYKKEFAGQPPIHAARGRVLELRMPEEPASIFTVPTSNPAAKDGIFYCEPAYYNVPHMNGQFEYVLVDTAKAIQSLKDHDPEMLDHALHKFSGSSAEDWLESNSPGIPRDMGLWVPSRDGKGITMNSGQAAHIQLVQELGVPYFPIAVDNGFGAQAQAIAGYGLSGSTCLPLIRPGFTSSDEAAYS